MNQQQEQNNHEQSSSSLLFVSGTVVHGFGRGSKELNCPTANIDPDIVARINDSLLAPSLFGEDQSGTGIFFGFAQLIRADDESNDVGGHLTVFPMSASFGFNPCYNNSSKSLEVHLIHPQTIPDFYGSRLKVVLVGKLRDECKFDSLHALTEQIERDKRNTIQRIESLPLVRRETIKRKLVAYTNEGDFVESVQLL